MRKFGLPLTYTGTRSPGAQPLGAIARAGAKPLATGERGSGARQIVRSTSSGLAWQLLEIEYSRGGMRRRPAHEIARRDPDQREVAGQVDQVSARQRRRPSLRPSRRWTSSCSPSRENSAAFCSRGLGQTRDLVAFQQGLAQRHLFFARRHGFLGIPPHFRNEIVHQARAVLRKDAQRVAGLERKTRLFERELQEAGFLVGPAPVESEVLQHLGVKRILARIGVRRGGRRHVAENRQRRHGRGRPARCRRSPAIRRRPVPAARPPSTHRPHRGSRRRNRPARAAAGLPTPPTGRSKSLPIWQNCLYERSPSASTE